MRSANCWWLITGSFVGIRNINPKIFQLRCKHECRGTAAAGAFEPFHRVLELVRSHIIHRDHFADLFFAHFELAVQVLFKRCFFFD